MRELCIRALTRQLLQSPTIRLLPSSQHWRTVNAWIHSGYSFAGLTIASQRSLPICEVHGVNMLLQVGCIKSTFKEQKRGITADRQTTALTIWKDLKHLKSSPVPALVLGFSGLIPFAAPPMYMFYMQTFIPQLVFAQMAYGACILSFLGGVRWGFVIPEGGEHRADWFNLGYSVALSLVAWVGLLLPVHFGVLTVMSGIAGAAYFDATMGGYPPWFKALRFMLSLGAVLSLWTGYLCHFVLKEKETTEKQEE